MIIASALGKLFDGLTINYEGSERAVQYHWGDQKELNKWVADRNAGNQLKYPLVWYILNDFTELNGWYCTEARIIIFQSTQAGWFNPKRQEESYTKIINPVAKIVKKRLKESLFVNVLGNYKDQFIEKDEPNYGVDTSDEKTRTSSDFNVTKEFNSQSITTDRTDARLIRFQLRIKAECLI
jgi:hypothetical protein